MANATETNREITEPWRKPNGQFGLNNPGKPKGAVHRINRETLNAVGEMRGEALAVLKQELANGNLRAACYVLDRFLPSERAVPLDSVHPESVVAALAAGDASPVEAARMANAMKTVSDASAVQELAAKVDELEAWIAQRVGDRG